MKFDVLTLTIVQIREADITDNILPFVGQTNATDC